ncbi:MAG TPA: hypothetical protein VMT19_11300 [Thermoanaerobaculaceae bacterium]|nr:hypothetical protein [Thermoanaerobaculaceae bacterium]
MTRKLVPFLIALFAAAIAQAQFLQQGDKLVGSGAAGAAGQGASVAVSADGNTAIVGGPGDNAGAGAAWVFVRSGGTWSQQGGKLVGTGAVGAAGQGAAVAISADGNTAIVGGHADNANVGTVWVFVRSGGAWTQQGSKLVPADAAGSPSLGTSVAISSDGNTAILGGLTDHSGLGAAFVFTRSGGAWSQQGAKLVGSGAVLTAEEGRAVAISGDGNTAVVGGFGDNNTAGAVWVFRRSGGAWSQWGSKLVGSDAVGAAAQGGSVAISSDGATLVFGGSQDADDTGAAWVFARNLLGIWVQQGAKLVGTGARASAVQGCSTAVSGDGKTVVVGGFGDYPAGAAWVFARSGGAWTQQGDKLVGTGAAGDSRQGWSVALSADGATLLVGGAADNAGAGAVWVFSTPAFTAWVPVASHNKGMNGSVWRSDLGLLNTGTATANVGLSFFGDSGVVGNTTYVPAGAQSILSDIVGQLGGADSGAIRITADQPVKVTARSYNLVASSATCYADGTQGQDYPAVASGDGLVATDVAYLAGLRESAAYRSNIGLVNTGPATATVLVELFDGSGTKLTDYQVTLAAGQWAQETQPFFNKAGQKAMDRGYARVTVQSGAGIFAFGSVIDNITNDPTTVTMQQ